MASKTTTCALLFASLSLEGSYAFSPVTVGTVQKTSVMPLFDGDGTGGWGIGSSRGISAEEFAKGDRRAFEGYKLTDRGEFMRTVKSESDAMKKAELDELLGVSNFAGINVKNPSDRLNKFEPDVFGDDDDDLDLSI